MVHSNLNFFNLDKEGIQNLPNTSSSSLWTFFWASGLCPSKHKGIVRVCGNAVRKAKPRFKMKFVRDVKNYKKVPEEFYHGIDCDKVQCIHLTPVEERSIRTKIKPMHWDKKSLIIET